MLHKNITTGDVHYIQNWSVADTTARDALTVVPADVGKVCQVTGTSKYFILTDDSPMTWQEIGAGSGAGTVTSVTSANADATVATTTTTPVITIVQTPALRSATTTIDVSAATAPTSGQVLTATSGTAATWQTPSAGGGSGITLGTPQNSTSGTSIDFTGIPSGTKQITIMLNGVSTNGTNRVEIQIGDAGGIETSGYNADIGIITATGGTNATSTTSFPISGSSGGDVYYGAATLFLMNSSTNTWAINGSIFRSGTNFMTISAGVKSLSAELTQIRITTAGGTDSFDAGVINIQYQ